MDKNAIDKQFDLKKFGDSGKYKLNCKNINLKEINKETTSIATKKKEINKKNKRFKKKIKRKK